MTRLLRRVHRRVTSGGTETGAVAAFAVSIAVALLLIGGLVVDGGRALNAREAAADDAEQAARAGADNIDEGVLRSTGEVRVNQVAARASASQFCASRGYAGADCDPTVTGNAVTVTTRVTVDTVILSIIPGLSTMTVSSSATAEPVQGIDGPLP